MIASEIKEGVTTLHLDKLAEEFIRDHGAVPSFQAYWIPKLIMYPNASVHGIPNNTPLKSGDVISVDCGAYKNGYHGDHIPLRLVK
jgi:methionyl aminopeptidase